MVASHNAVFRPGQVANMPDVHVYPREDHFACHAPTVDRADRCMEQAVAQPRVLDDASLVLAQAVVAS